MLLLEQHNLNDVDKDAMTTMTTTTMVVVLVMVMVHKNVAGKGQRGMKMASGHEGDEKQEKKI